MPYVKCVLFFCAGLIYSVLLTFLGIINTGMGHGTGTSIFWTLALSPIPLIYWAAVGLLLCWVRVKSIKILIACLTLLHYLSFFVYSQTDLMSSRYEDFSAVWQRDPGGIILTLIIYFAGQFMIWSLLIFSRKEKYREVK